MSDRLSDAYRWYMSYKGKAARLFIAAGVMVVFAGAIAITGLVQRLQVRDDLILAGIVFLIGVACAWMGRQVLVRARLEGRR